MIGILLGFGCNYLLVRSNVISISNGEDKRDTNASREDLDDTLKISKDSLYIKELIDAYDISFISNVDVWNSLYSKDKITVNEFSSELLNATAMKKANKEFLGNLFVSGEEFLEAGKMLYGNQVAFQNQTFSIAKGCTKYNFNNGYYSVDPESGACGGISMLSMDRTIVDAVRKDNTLEVTVAIALKHSGENKVYKDKDATKLIENVTADTFNIDNYTDSLDKFKYVFTYDKENDGYYLNYIEKVK